MEDKRSVIPRRLILLAIASAALIGLVLLVLWIFVWSINITTTQSFTGVVVTNGYSCSKIGTKILSKGGSAADAAIASLFCEGVSMPQSMGLGGGFLLTIYDRKSGRIETLNSREVAPAAATSDMFNGSASLSQIGGLAVAVPGELKGYWYLHKKYGRLPWKDLIQPTINLCTDGIYVTDFLAGVFSGKTTKLYNDPVLRSIFIDPSTNRTYPKGHYLKRPKLAATLKIIATEGVDALYNRSGSLAKNFVNDIQENGGIITIDDLENYEPIWQDAIKSELSGDYKLYTIPPPGSGVIMTFILNILDGFIDFNNLYTSNAFHRIVESFKFGYGARTQLGDDRYVNIKDILDNLKSKLYAEEIRLKIFDNQTSQDPTYYGANTTNVEDHGTAHLCILAPNGDAVSVTSTINDIFGAAFASKSTGIILNNQMDDFSSPNITNIFGMVPSEANFIEPGKRPLSSMVPSIVLKNNRVVLITGAAGGTKITTTVLQIIIKHLWYNIDLKQSIDEIRIHHQLFPMTVQYELEYKNMFPEIVKNLSSIGHQSQFITLDDGFAAATSISALNDTYLGAYDRRRGGDISYLYS